MEVREVMRKTIFRNFIVTERERKKKITRTNYYLEIKLSKTKS